MTENTALDFDGEIQYVNEIRVREEIVDDLHQAWGKYTHNFGEPPHGTTKQLSAMLCFANRVEVLIKAEAERNGFKERLDALPADWRKDSSLETWFPITAETLKQLKAERDALGEQLEHDRTLVADCVTAATKAVQMRDWLTEGRGPYEWNDDNWHKEFYAAATEFLTAIEPMRKVAADWSGCPKDAEAVAKARLDLQAEHHRRGIAIIHWTGIARAHLCRAEKAEGEIKADLELIPERWRVTVREGGAEENPAASLAVSIAKLAKSAQALYEAHEAIRALFSPDGAFQIQKIRGPITNGDQDVIDAAFMKQDKAMGETR